MKNQAPQEKGFIKIENYYYQLAKGVRFPSELSSGLFSQELSYSSKTISNQ